MADTRYAPGDVVYNNLIEGNTDMRFEIERVEPPHYVVKLVGPYVGNSRFDHLKGPLKLTIQWIDKHYESFVEKRP